MTEKHFLFFLFSVGIFLGLFFNDDPSEAGEFHINSTPSGAVGISTGPSIHNGRTHVVDGITGATQTETIQNWSTYAFNAAIILDMGIPTSAYGLDGTFGVRILNDVSIPKKIFSQALLARYRFQFNLSGASLHSIEPWVGIGIGFFFVPAVSEDVFVQLPIAAGCDFGVGDQWLISTDLQLNSMNPVGPFQHPTTASGIEYHKPRYDSYILRIGLAFRFY